MKSSRFEKVKKENIIKEVRNLFRLKEETDETTIKDARFPFRLKKENEVVKDRIIRDVRNLFEYEEENCYKPLRVGYFWSNNYIKYESNSDKNKTLSVKKYLNKIKPSLKDVMNDLRKSKPWKIQLTIAINFISSIDNDACNAFKK